MGINYYVKSPENPKCECCGHQEPSEDKHIGKSSYGWNFALHVYPEEGINDLDDWIPILKDSEIVDESDCSISFEQLMDTITKRKRTSEANPWNKNDNITKTYKELITNDIILTEKGLARMKLSSFCIKHGQGTWDCFIGSFS